VLDGIRQEFFRFAPAYATEEAGAALDKILELQSQGLIRNGLYYVVLADLAGSTAYQAEHGDVVAADRIQHFVLGAFNGLNEVHLTNLGVFIKELGDAVLLIFQCFVDVLRWHTAFAGWQAIYRSDKPEHQIRFRTCVHVGDVILHGINPISLAVSQLFKLEKSVPDGELVLTNPAYMAAWPTLARAYHAFDDVGTVELDGYPRPVALHRLRLEIGTAAALADERLD